MYLGTWTNVFGLVGALSGVYDTNFCPNYMAWLAAEQPRDARVWMDVGTVGRDIVIGDTYLYQSNWELYWHLMGFGYVPGADLHFMIGCGQDHNEAAWASRLPFIYRVLLDVREEPNPLLAPELAPGGAPGQMAFPVYRGTAYAVEKTSSPTSGWNSVTNWARESRPWSNRTVNLQALSATGGFFRVRGE